MDGAVDFDDEAGGATVEVGDESVDDLLPAEVQAPERIAPHLLPQQPLFDCRLSPHLPRPVHFPRIDPLPGDDPVSFHPTSPRTRLPFPHREGAGG